MSLLSFFTRRNSAPVARERLQILLAHERAAGKESNLVARLQEDILQAIAKHIAIDRNKVVVKVDRSSGTSTLAIDVEIPSAVSSFGANTAKLAS
jgi:cell division topological specificity factor